MTAAADNSDPRDYVLNLSTQTAAASPATTAKEPDANGALPRSLSIHFKCCHVYAAIYRAADGKKFAGHCPRCRRPIEIGIAPGGSTSRIFQAG